MKRLSYSTLSRVTRSFRGQSYALMHGDQRAMSARAERAFDRQQPRLDSGTTSQHTRPWLLTLYGKVMLWTIRAHTSRKSRRARIMRAVKNARLRRFEKQRKPSMTKFALLESLAFHRIIPSRTQHVRVQHHGVETTLRARPNTVPSLTAE